MPSSRSLQTITTCCIAILNVCQLKKHPSKHQYLFLSDIDACATDAENCTTQVEAACNNTICHTCFTCRGKCFILYAVANSVLCSPEAPQLVSISTLQEEVVTAGGRYTLQCNATRDATLVNSTILEVMWLGDDLDTFYTSGTAYNVSGMLNTTLVSNLTFPQLSTSQGGRYSCFTRMTFLGTGMYWDVTKTAPVIVASESN